jgi:uncharacterized damage-inducible protein DinB
LRQDVAVADPRIDPPFAGGELETLTGFLSYLRATIQLKAADLTQAQMHLTTAASSMTLAGLLKHLWLVEDRWFTVTFAGRDTPAPWSGVDWDSDQGWEWRSARGDDPDALRQAYRDACARSDAIIAVAASLDQTSVRAHAAGEQRWSLRWIITHMIEETARHAGHADLLREAIDGEVGE